MTEDETKKSSSWHKFFAINSKPTIESYPELADHLVWMRFVLAVIYGVWLSMMRLSSGRGGSNFVFGLNFVTFVPILYTSSYLGADTNSFEARVLFGGVINSIALLLLIWTYFYTLAHAEDEKILVSILESALEGAIPSTSDPVITDASSSPDPPVESEF